jgi:hypothetical protein
VEPCPEPEVIEVVVPGAPAETAAPTLSAARAAWSRGERADALSIGLDVLTSLVDGGADSPTLRLLLGQWAEESGDPATAERLYTTAAEAARAGEGVARKADASAQRVRVAALPTDARALEDARAALADGRSGDADRALAALLAGVASAQVAAEAEALRRSLRAQAVETARTALPRADAVLSGSGPWEEAAALLDAVTKLPRDTYDGGELLRLQALLAGRQREAQSGQAAAASKARDALLADARALVAATKYRDAIVAFGKLDGTVLESTARKEAAGAAESLVKEERDRAGRMFVEARKLQDGSARRAALQAVADLLRSLLAEFPAAPSAERVRSNLAAVEAELGKAP